ncbi:5'-nucleotidase C-terminal domain-containing protein [Orenia marismortui]|uniref:5'-nucleotidase C-terminal domain-containing protein n=1 Tax=Orenia marismortui TaxID=46469 RepID=UPI00036D4AD8|nr:5'-nucleotidase C-terminal domain-containing protein [Orenia marismortui]
MLIRRKANKLLILSIVTLGLFVLLGCSDDSGNGTNLSGKIVDFNGVGIEGVTLTFDNGDGTAITDKDGNWSKGGLEEGDVVIPVKEGYSFDPESHAIKAGQGNGINFMATREVQRKEGEFYLTHTNDIHGRVEEGSYAGMGLAKLKTKIDQLKEEREVLVLDAGDTIHGQTIVQLSEGESMIEIMNAMGYQAMAAGNHDFNYGQERLLELDELADFPILAANIYKDNEERLLKAYRIKEVAGNKVGIFGLSTPETTYKTHPDNVKGLEFRNPIEEAKIMVNQLQTDGCSIIIALTHLGVDESSEYTSEMVAEQTQGIDLIVDGHSHTELTEGKLVNETLIVQAKEYDKNLGIVDIRIDQDGKLDIRASLFTKEDAANLEGDTTILDIIDQINAENDEILSEIVGSTEVVLEGARDHVRTSETNLGNLITDAMLKETGADIAITNGGGIRDSIDTGKITLGEVITVLPFGNYVVVKELSGADIKAALEHGLSSYPDTLGAFPHIAGMKVKFNPSQKAGDRVVEVTINGRTLDETKTYQVATNDFMAAGGDDYKMFADDSVVGEYDGLDQVLKHYIQSLENHTVTADIAKVEGRITVVQ